MEGEAVSLSYSSESRKSVGTISILVVDDDRTCLSIVAAILKKFKYEVATAKHPNDALCTLRIKGAAFNLVVSDVHMPDMNGFELQQAITQEFNLPVVLMSADSKEGIVSKGLENGAALFISKPVSPDDLRDLWQFAATNKRNQVVTEETGNSEETSPVHKNDSDQIAVSAATVNEDWPKEDSNRKSPREEGSDEKRGDKSQTKKAKLMWTNALHNRFLEAIRTIGFDRSVPKKILEVMDVPGLTRENVASHLQKYRIFVRRVSDQSCKIRSVDDKGLTGSYRSSFPASGSDPSVLMLNRLSNFHHQNHGSFPNQEALSRSYIPQSGFGQPQLLSSTGSFPPPNIRNAAMIHHNVHPSVGLMQNSCQIGTIQGHISSFDTSILGSTTIDPSISDDVSSSNISSLVPPNNFRHQRDYMVISNIKHLGEPGRWKEYEVLNSWDGMMNLHHNEFLNISVNAAPLPNDNMNVNQLAQHSGASSSYVSDSTYGKQSSDVIADYQNLLLPSGLPLQYGNLENEGQIHEPTYTPMHHLPAYDVGGTQQPPGEGDLNNTFADQVNIQNQAQLNGAENITSSSFHDSMDNWDNHVSSFDQAPNQQQCQGLTKDVKFGTSSQFNTALQPPNERNMDDEFLESLLVFGPQG